MTIPRRPPHGHSLSIYIFLFSNTGNTGVGQPLVSVALADTPPDFYHYEHGRSCTLGGEHKLGLVAVFRTSGSMAEHWQTLGHTFARHERERLAQSRCCTVLLGRVSKIGSSRAGLFRYSSPMALRIPWAGLGSSRPRKSHLCTCSRSWFFFQQICGAQPRYIDFQPIAASFSLFAARGPIVTMSPISTWSTAVSGVDGVRLVRLPGNTNSATSNSQLNPQDYRRKCASHSPHERPSLTSLLASLGRAGPDKQIFLTPSPGTSHAARNTYTMIPMPITLHHDGLPKRFLALPTYTLVERTICGVPQEGRQHNSAPVSARVNSAVPGEGGENVALESGAFDS